MSHALTSRGPTCQAAMREVLRLVANDVRRHTLVELAASPSEVSALARRLRRPIASVSANLSPLRASGLVTVRKDGPWRIYSLGPSIDAQVKRHETVLNVPTREGGRVTLAVPRRAGAAKRRRR